ncbi:MAG TPA: DUF6624 domain-containing protein [Rhodothermales bacterium]|nr:DUF6624 domain-containing protein [Rhodothermales bacterium]
MILWLLLAGSVSAQQKSLELPYINMEMFQAATEAGSQGDHQRAAQIWQNILESTERDPNLLFIVALSFADADSVDRAFAYLDEALELGFGRFEYLRTYPALKKLHDNPRWPALLEKADARQAMINEPLRQELLAMAEKDQAIRNAYGAAVQEYGYNAPQADSLRTEMETIDQAHEARLKEIVATYGWPKRRLVSRDGAHAAWLLLQHGTLDVQVEMLPLLLEAAEQGEASWSDVAYVQDRVLFYQGKPQIYGTQLREYDDGRLEVAPIADEAHVDERRARAGLQPLAEYLRQFGITHEPSNTEK